MRGRIFYGMVVMGLLWALGSVQVYAQPNEEVALQAYIRAENMKRTKRYIEAIFEYDKAISADPANFKFIFSKGQCYYMLRDAENAITAFKKTVEIKKDFIPAYTLMAQCYKAQRKPEEIVVSLDNAFKYETDVQKKLKYKLTIINTLVRSGEYGKAKTHIAEARKLSPSDPDLLFYEAKTSNELGDFNTAKQAMLTATRQLPTKEPKYAARFYYELGYAFYKLGQYELAFDAWQYANHGYFKNLIYKFDPKNYFSTAQSYYKIYDFTLAKEYLTQTLRMQHNYTQAHILMAEITKKETNRNDAALTHYLEAVKNEPNLNNKFDMYKSITYGEMDAGKFGDAVTYAKEALAIRPTEHSLMFVQAMAYYRMKNFVEAVKILENLVVLPGIDFESKAMYYFGIAAVRRAMNQVDKAREAYKKADYGSFSRAAQMEYDKITPKKPEEEKSPVEEVFDVPEGTNNGG